MARQSRTERLMARMQRVRGYRQPEWDLAARLDPGFLETYHALYERALASGRGLSVKHRELVVLGVLAFRGASREAIANHIRRAYRHGATRAEVFGAFEAAIVPGGAITFFNGVRALAEVEEGRRPRPRAAAR